MAYPTDNGIPSLSGKYIPEIWSGQLLVKFYAATVLAAISNTDYEGEIKKFGDKVKIRSVPDMTITDYTIGVPLTYQRPTTETIDLLIDKGKYFAFSVNSVEKFQSDIEYVSKWALDGSEQMKIRIDSDVLADIYADVHADNAGATAGAISGNVNLGATGSAISVSKTNVIDKITELGQVLDEQNVPEQGRWLVVPSWMSQRIKTSDLKDASLSGDNVSSLRNGRLGMIDRFTLYSSNSVAHVTDTVECYHVLAGHRSALTFASQLVENETLKNPTDFGDLIRGLQVYGYKVVKPEAIATLYCKPA